MLGDGVTVTAIGSSRDRANVVDPLAALVRVEFLADYIGPDPAGVYSVRPCEVKGCGRVRHSDARPLCSLHLRRRRRDGEAVDLATWVRLSRVRLCGRARWLRVVTC